MHDASLSPKLSAQAVDQAWAALLEAVERLPGTSTFGEIMAVALKGARDLSAADGVTFVRRDGDLCHYVDEDAIGPLWKGKRFPMTACISGWCMLNRQTAVIPDIYRDSRIPTDAYRPTFVKTLVMVPVRTDDPIAAIGTYWATQQIPDAHTVMMLEALANSAGTAILNAHALEAQR